MISTTTLFYDKLGKKPIIKEIELEMVEAGKEENRIIYIKNNLSTKISLSLDIKDNNQISIIKLPNTLQPYQIQEIEFKIITKLLEDKPVTALLNIISKWVVK